jgi:hypothetical protein
MNVKDVFWGAEKGSVLSIKTATDNNQDRVNDGQGNNNRMDGYNLSAIFTAFCVFVCGPVFQQRVSPYELSGMTS